MKSVLTAAALAAALVSLASPAAAAGAGEVYGTLGMSVLNPGLDLRLPLATARLGWQSDSWYGVEAEGSVSLDTVDFQGVDIKLSREGAIYGVASYKTDRGTLFARVGGGTQTYKLSVGPYADSFVQKSFNAGLGGVLFDKGGQNGIRLDALHKFYPGEDADEVSVSFIRKFN